MNIETEDSIRNLFLFYSIYSSSIPIIPIKDTSIPIIPIKDKSGICSTE